MYLKGELQREAKEGEGGEEVSFIHYFISQMVTKLGAQSVIWVAQVGSRDPKFWAFLCAFPRLLARK